MFNRTPNPQTDPITYGINAPTRLFNREQDAEQGQDTGRVPTIGGLVRKGSQYGRCDSEPRTDRFPGDNSPRVYVVALDGSWADWWLLSDLKVVRGGANLIA